MENIITFGSCLSRYVARSYKRLFSANIISSVYHNRSDAFLKGIESGSFGLDNDFIDFIGTLKNEDAHSIIQNQTFSGIGKHHLDVEVNLFEALENNNVDIVIIDNFMDLSARLASPNGFSSCKDVFIRKNDVDDFDSRFTLGEYIEPKDSIVNMHRICDFFLEMQKNIKIVFINFPHNTYDDVGRKYRTIEFFKGFKKDGVIIIPPMNIPKIYRTDVASHFDESQYSAYAGIIRALIRGQEIL
ncbi:hypothetical protein AB2M45_003023 [Vibrio cholerae]|nr:hypothetical protein [Vibrio cholerae]EHU6506330.1 hypothetical protein [Vibrio cholerae]EKF9161326.1 hypothetical protein [Vibrio cholerae]ELT6289205.1 hypothetical protein [Vibrio cholerae]